MSDLAGPVKQLVLAIAEAKDPTVPRISHSGPANQIKDLHRWIVGALSTGFTAREVAGMFDVSESYVHQINNWKHPILDLVKRESRDRMAKTVEDLSLQISHHAAEALQVTVGIMRGQDVSNARLAAKDIMDRAGYAPVKKVMELQAPVPSEEFVQAVAKMEAASRVVDQKAEWAWVPPVKTIPAPTVDQEIHPTRTVSV